jgi:tetratricopeptide (TPR) repeat protein
MLLLFSALAPLAWSQQLGSIVGEVRITRGNFPEQILVNLQTRGATVQSTYTDGAGRFGFNAVYANVYHVVINEDHYQPVDMQVELKPDIQPVYILQINLVPRELASTAKSKPYVVSAQDLTRKYPKQAVKEFERGARREAEGKTEDAIQHFKRALKIAPDFAMAHNSLGAAYVSKSEFADAQKELAEAIRLDRSSGGAYFNMANLMLLTSKLGQAGEYLRQGFFLEPDSAFGFFVQGSVLERTGKLPEAEASLQRALQLDPKMPRPHLELVNLYLREQRSTQAMAELHSFLQIAPKDPLAPKAREVLQRLERTTSKASQP